MEVWTISGKEHALFTESPSAARMLKRDINRYATYFKKGRSFAWQFVVPQSRLKFLCRRIIEIEKLEKECVENQQVTGESFAEFDHRRMIHSREGKTSY